MKLETRKFSFDPSTKKIFPSDCQTTEGGSPAQIYENGKLVENDESLSTTSQGKDFWKQVGKTMNEEEESPIAYLKSVISSDLGCDEECESDCGEFNLDNIRSDEELATESLCEFKMFSMLNN